MPYTRSTSELAVLQDTQKFAQSPSREDCIHKVTLMVRHAAQGMPKQCERIPNPCNTHVAYVLASVRQNCESPESSQ
jgi:hypothetical protein